MGGEAIRQRKEPLMGEAPRLREETSALLSGNLQSDGGVQALSGQAKQEREGDHGVGFEAQGILEQSRERMRKNDGVLGSLGSKWDNPDATLWPHDLACMLFISLKWGG